MTQVNESAVREWAERNGWDPDFAVEHPGTRAMAEEAIEASSSPPSPFHCGGCGERNEETPRTRFDNGGGEVVTCAGCGGMVGWFATRVEACRHGVDYSRWNEGPDGETRYFDFMIQNPQSPEGRRVHGWYSVASGRMTQSG